jgi:hypothetical protein
MQSFLFVTDLIGRTIFSKFIKISQPNFALLYQFLELSYMAVVIARFLFLARVEILSNMQTFKILITNVKRSQVLLQAFINGIFMEVNIF